MLEKYADIMVLEEVCEVLHMSRNSTYALLKSGELKAFQQGRIWKVPKVAVIQFIAERSGLDV